jgi:hypothetical protein
VVRSFFFFPCHAHGAAHQRLRLFDAAAARRADPVGVGAQRWRDVNSRVRDAGSYGYTFDDSRLYLNGGVFSRGRQNITCTYTAGYQASETSTIPSDSPAQLTPTTGGRAISVVSVVNAAGAALTQVAASPATGQFSFAAGCFTFAAADVGTSVTLTYGYAPAPVEQACIEMVGLDLKSRDNLGITSKSLAGETISYSSRGLTDSVKEQLMPYRRMLIA